MSCEISVIVINWNGKQHLQCCLESLHAQSQPAREVILVDNGSTDGSVEYVNEHFPEVDVLALDTNLGFAAANNRAIDRAKGEWILLLNNDTEMHPDCLKELDQASTKHPQHHIFATSMHLFDHRNRIDNLGFGLNLSGMTLEHDRYHLEDTSPLAQATRTERFGACAGAAMYHRSVFDRIGKLRDEFFMIYEDVDLAYRANLVGFRCLHLPRAKVYHKLRASIASQASTYYSQRNVELMVAINTPSKELIKVFVWRVLYNLGALLHFVSKGQGLSYLKAKLSLIFKLGYILKERTKVRELEGYDPARLDDVQSRGIVWQKILKVLRREVVRLPQQKRLLVFMELIQDLDVALPILKRLKTEGHDFDVWVVAWLLEQSPRVAQQLKIEGIPFQVVSRRRFKLGWIPSLSPYSGVMTVAESSLGPHRAARMLVHKANRCQIPTYTHQHGLENIGLTYFDGTHGQQVNIYSRTIFIWGESDTLLSDVDPQIRHKCVSVGCPKECRLETPEMPSGMQGKTCICVFENLHWHRYSENYRRNFMENLARAIEEHPDIHFIAKPHHAGKWLTTKYRGTLPKAQNFSLADPDSPQWESYTAPALIAHSLGVITTPSTVSLDAAQADKPVAIIEEDLDAPIYQPLTRLHGYAEWKAFIDALLNDDSRREQLELGMQFRERVMIPGDSCAKIIGSLQTEGTL